MDDRYKDDGGSSPALSIIVPFYKVEKYACGCIESILSQSFTDFELILVDDGSPDRCGEICDRYAAKDVRIFVVHKCNGGLSSARNAGLEIAKADIIGFVDGDDTVEPDMFLEMVRAMKETGADIVVCGVNMVYSGNNVKRQPWQSEYRKMYSSEEALAKIFDGEWDNYVWNKIYRRSIIDPKFPDGLKYEDIRVMPHWFGNASHICQTSFTGYNYLQRQDSIVREIDKSAQLQYLTALFSQVDFIKSSRYKERFYNDRLLFAVSRGIGIARDYARVHNFDEQTRDMFDSVLEILHPYESEFISVLGGKQLKRYNLIKSDKKKFYRRVKLQGMFKLKNYLGRFGQKLNK